MIAIQNYYQLFYENLISFTVLILVSITLIRKFMNGYAMRKQLPPGPYALPIVGYVPFLGNEPHKSITKLSEKYGNVFTLKLWFKNIVILNDFEAVKDALTNDSLLGRPIKHYFSYFNISPSFVDDSGQVWHENRRFSIKLMGDLGSGKARMEDKIIDEIHYLIKRIDQNSGQPINISEMLIQSTSNTFSELVFGHRFDEDDPKRKIIDRTIESFASTLNPIGLLAVCPDWLTILVLRLKGACNTHANMKSAHILEQELSEHIQNFNENNIMDYLDGYLAEMKIQKLNNPNTSFTMDKLLANSYTIFTAGSDTLWTVTNWTIRLAALHIDYQRRVQDEIDSVVGTQRSVRWADRLLMPFTQAFICEVFRFISPHPFNSYRRALEDTYILNHFIPKDTLVLANFWAVNRDPKLWDNPEQFNPDRFLSIDGKQLIKTDYLIPFSMGKRICAGEGIARIEVFLYFSSLLQRFSITSVEGNVISTEAKFGLSLQPKQHSIYVFKSRV